MVYASNQAIADLQKYLPDLRSAEIIDNTKKRGFLYQLPNKEKVVIYVYPLVHKQDNTKNYFDTRDSGVTERIVAWNYANNNNYKYFCFGINTNVSRYNDYVFSLECDNNKLELISGTKNGKRNGKGNQIIIPNNYSPSGKFERFTNKIGVYIAVIHKDDLLDYMLKFDNRPYMLDVIDTPSNILEEEENKKHFCAWLGEQVIPKSDTDYERHYTAQEIDDYVNTLTKILVTLNGKEYSVFATNDIEKINAVKNADNQNALDVYCSYLAYSKKGILENAQIKEFFKHNRIIFGAPGTGKSYLLNKECESSFAPCQYERVTFYPSYTYAKFFGSYKPVNGGNGIEYKFVPGPFVRVWIKAMTDIDHSYLLIIDEINRAEVAAVFGDVFQLLDRTDGRSTYDIDISEELKQYLEQEDLPMAQESKMYIPDNMFIWATMNSADQGVYPVDTAFKRRWDFEYISLNDNENQLNTNEFTIKTADEIQKFRWNDVRKAINTWLSKKGVNEDKLMGPFFLAAEIVGTDVNEDKYDEHFIESFKHKVLMYLFDDAGKPKRRELFAGAGEDNNRYSAITEAFAKKGMRIFNNDIFQQMNVTVTADAESSEEES